MKIDNSYTYLDWAATTPLCAEAWEAMLPFNAVGVPGGIEYNANANSLHTPGRNAFRALEDARTRIARSIGARRPTEVIFTSGATESDNTAILGMAAARLQRERQKGNSDYVPHIVVSAIEHDAVLSLVPLMRSRGWDVDVLKPDTQGRISTDNLLKNLRDDTAVVSIMWANNEIGTLQDVRALADCAHSRGALFHTDATQALGKIAIDVSDAGIDAASFSAHKICGPKGVGALFLKAGTACDPLLLGGGQELGRRSGTQNVAGAVGFAAACEYACTHVDEERERLSALRDTLYARLCEDGDARPTCDEAPGSDGFLPNIVNVLVPGYESETLILQLDIAGFAVSGGSACSTGSLDPSHVLSALGINRNDALCSLRVSMGRFTTEEDIQRFADAFHAVVSR